MVDPERLVFDATFEYPLRSLRRPSKFWIGREQQFGDQFNSFVHLRSSIR